jgi:hypothetical protein
MVMEETKTRMLADRCRLKTQVLTGGEPVGHRKENPMLWMIAAILVFP